MTVDDLALTVLTEQPGVQVYAGGKPDATSVGDRGIPYGPGTGIVLKCQNFPDAPTRLTPPDTSRSHAPPGGCLPISHRMAAAT